MSETKLENINWSENNIGAEGAKAIIDNIKAVGGIGTLDVSSTGDEAEEFFHKKTVMDSIEIRGISM